jgi:hypothetical protein
VVTVFSAPRYAARYSNKAAVLQILDKVDDVALHFIQYDSAEHSAKKRPSARLYVQQIHKKKNNKKIKKKTEFIMRK